MARLRAVLFDYGNVLVRWDPRHLYRKLFADPAEMERFLAEVLTMEWHIPNDSGVVMGERVAALAARHPHYADEIAAFQARYAETIAGEIEGSIALLDKLAAAGAPLGLLTNMPLDQQEACFSHCTRLHLFKAIVVSGAEKISKPDPRIYALALERLGADAAETLFVDDSPANVAGAERAGLAAHLFTSPAKLGQALEAAGLIA
ncbi:MAG: HAD family hydrolase [Hyphomonadaceae bacterium]